jgi:hypothetical protein
VSELLDAPRIRPERDSIFLRANVAQLERYGFTTEKSFKRIPPQGTPGDEMVHTTPDVLPTPPMKLPYYLAHHVLLIACTECECEYMIRKLAAAARSKLHMHATKDLLNEVEERNGDMAVGCDGEVDLEDDAAVFLAANKQWAASMTAKEAQAAEDLLAGL